MLEGLGNRDRKGEEATEGGHLRQAVEQKLFSVSLSPGQRSQPAHSHTCQLLGTAPPPPRGQKLLPGGGIDGYIHFLYFVVCPTMNRKEAPSALCVFAEGLWWPQGSPVKVTAV